MPSTEAWDWERYGIGALLLVSGPEEKAKAIRIESVDLHSLVTQTSM
jgi:hypothetical protein